MDFSLRKWAMTDTECFYKYGCTENVTPFLRDTFPSTLEQAAKTVKYFAESDETRMMCRAIDINGEAAGSIGLFLQGDIYSKTAEIAYWLGIPYQGNGIVTKAVIQLCGEAFERYDILRIYAEPFAHNTGSRRVLEKSGFVLEGIMKNGVYKNGRCFDYCMYALLK